jgi:hypothetical protein
VGCCAGELRNAATVALGSCASHVPRPLAAIKAVIARGAPGEYGSAEDAAIATFVSDTAVLDALEEHAAAASGMVLGDRMLFGECRRGTTRLEEAPDSAKPTQHSHSA